MQELRPLAPVECEVVIYRCDQYVFVILIVHLLTLRLTFSPITEAYRSALAFADQDQFAEFSVTRAEYLESGSNACRRKFKDWRSSDEVLKDESNLKAKSKGKQREEGGRIDTRVKTRKTSTSTRRR